MTKIVKIWSEAATDLKLEIVTPFFLIMPDQKKIEFDVLLKNFGAKNGMLVVDTLSTVKGYFDVIQSMEYGCSVLSRYPDSYRYDRDDFQELLDDWGWTGPIDEKPPWLRDL